MQPFVLERVQTLESALTILGGDPEAWPIAGGTELVNWMKEGIVSPGRLVDINTLPGLDQVALTSEGLELGALVRMSDVAAHPDVQSNYPAISEALLHSASAQLRNMATMGGNLLQRTRCPYFRAEVDLPCNKRRPGTGCAALVGDDRASAIFGRGDRCVATHPSDVAVALTALDAVVHVRASAGRERSIPLVDLYRSPGDSPERDTRLERDELITRITVPASPLTRRSHYLKVRERSSYEFALVSAAVALELDAAGLIRQARIALGGVAHKPWRLSVAESGVVGVSVADADGLRARVQPAFAEAGPGRHNAFKVELAEQTVVRALQHTVTSQ